MNINHNELFKLRGQTGHIGGLHRRLKIAEKLLMAMVDAGRSVSRRELRYALSRLSGRKKASQAALQNHLSSLLKAEFIERPDTAMYAPTDAGYKHVRELKKQGVV